jgi:hypothetical protein
MKINIYNEGRSFPNQGKAITNKERLEIVTKSNFNKGTKTTHK